ncbi:MAG: hypothetical protein M1457_01670 [bacterium]|nr:hypothetical protein [bacterium]
MALSIVEMRNLIKRMEQAQALEEEIPQAYLDRLQRGAELLTQLKNLPAVDWDALKTTEDIEKAEAIIHEKLQLKNDIEKHLHTCAVTVSPQTRGRGKVGVKRGARRSKAQIEYDRIHAEIVKAKKDELGLAPRGRLRDDDQEKLDRAVEKELKRLKLAPPASSGEMA